MSYARIIKKLKVKIRCTCNSKSFETCDQIIHPSIIYDRHERYYLVAVTPYPYGDPRYENPSLLVSHHDLHTLTEDNIKNPLYPPPPDVNEGGHSADPEIIYFLEKYFLLFGMYSPRSKIDNYIILQSSGRNYTQWHYYGRSDINFSNNISLSIVCDKNECVAWCVDPTEKPFAVRMYSIKENLLDFDYLGRVIYYIRIRSGIFGTSA